MTPLYSARALAVIVPLSACAVLHSQTARTPALPDDSEPIVVMSPFVVNTERDTGYQATDTLAGTRLATPLRDIGASISVYTRDFLTDIGATNANELLVFATGMEAGGTQGNFSGTNAGITERNVVGDGPRIEPQSATRTRGLASPEFTRGFFISDIPIDGYNTTAVTVNRGPNAILFGIGSPAGVVDTALVQANLMADSSKLEHRFGNNNSHRLVLDLNRVLWTDRLALRFVGLDDQERFNQKPAYENKRRYYGALAFKPFGGSTQLRASFESGDTRANRPITVLPFDSISKFWWDAGRPTYDWSFYDDPDRNPLAATQVAGPARLPPGVNSGQIFNTIVIPYPPGSAVPDRAFRSTIGNTNISGPNSLTANNIRNQLFHPLLNRDMAVDGIQFYETVNIGETAMPASTFPGGIRPAGIKTQGFVDYSAFPFHKRMIDETSSQKNDFNTYTLTLEHTFWRDERGSDRLGVELAYYWQEFHRFSSNQFFSEANGNHIRIDPNVTLPDGRPNPNVGRPYASGSVGSQTNRRQTEREVMRATAFARYDFRDVFPEVGGWLGRHTLTGLYEEYTADVLNYATRTALAGLVADLVNANIAGFSRRGAILAYMGPSVLDGSPLRLEPIRIPPIRSGLIVPTSYFSAPAGSPAQGTIQIAPTSLVDVLGGGQVSREIIESRAAILQSYWLHDHVITTVGWRRDEDYLFRKNFVYADNPFKTFYNLGDFDLPSRPPFTAAGEVTSYSVVVRWPRKLVPLPRGTDLTVFFNDSGNFTPAGSRITARGERVPSPSGNTQEFGLSLSLFEDKLTLRAARFETAVQNQTFSSPAYSAAYNNGVRQLASFWSTERNINPHIDRTAEIELLLNAVPGFRELIGWAYTGGGDQPYGSVGEIPAGIADTTDYVAKGIETEIVYNPLRNWRIAFNLAQQETVQSNIAPGTRDFIERVKPVWAQLADRPRTQYPAGHVLGDPLPPGVETVGAWVQTNVLVPYATTLAAEGQKSAEQRKWRANLVTNYSFPRDSRLKGWAIGTGIRWQDKYALGYPTSFRPDGSVFIDIANPYWSKADLNVDAWVSYRRSLFDGRINWRSQINVRNLVGDSDPLAITVQPDGSPAVTRLPPERRIYWSNTFEF